MARTHNGQTVEFAYIQFEFCFQMENGNGILKTRGTLTPVAGHGGRPGGRHGHGHGGRPRANLKILSCQSTGTMVLIIAHQSLPVYEFTTDPDGPSKIVHETPNETLTGCIRKIVDSTYDASSYIMTPAGTCWEWDASKDSAAPTRTIRYRRPDCPRQ